MRPKDTAVNDEAVTQNTATTEPAPVETNSTEVAEDDPDLKDFDRSFDEESPDAEAETEGQETEPEEQAKKPAPSEENQVEATETEAQPLGEKPLNPKSENRFQQLANQNRELREQVEALKAREAQVAAEQGLMNEVNPETGEYYTPAEAERIARTQSNEQMQQRLAQERYELEVQQNQQLLATEAQEIVATYPMFDSQSPQFNPQLANRAEALLRQSLITDQNGRVIGSQLSPKQIYQTIAESSQANAAQHQAKAQKATEKMLANADVVGASSTASQAKDSDLDDFDRAWDELDG